MIDSFVKFAMDPPTILWLVGLALAYHLYRRSIRVAAMRFQSRTISLLDANTRSMFSELEMKFMGRQVTSLKRTWIVLWNRGTAAVRREEFATHDPLQIICTDGEILRCVIRKASNPANDFKLPEYSPGAKILMPQFEYFDPKDGVQLEIWHTGDASKIVAGGSIIGAGKVSETIANAEKRAYRKIPKPGTVHWGYVAFVAAIACSMLWATVGGGFDTLLEKIPYGSPTQKMIDNVVNIIGYVFEVALVLFWIAIVGAMIAVTSMQVPKGLAFEFEEPAR